MPLGSRVLEANPAEVALVEHPLNAVVPRQRCKITRFISDQAYDSDRLRTHLAAQNIDLICPHQKPRKKKPTQDGRSLRRYRHRWKIERTFAWLGKFRCLVVRYERNPDLYLAFFQLACAIIALRHL